MNNKTKTIDEILNLFKGKGGDPESESVLLDSNHDKKDGFVSFYSNKSDAAKVIERCKEGIISFELIGDGVQLKIDRKWFRGMVFAFKKR